MVLRHPQSYGAPRVSLSLRSAGEFAGGLGNGGRQGQLPLLRGQLLTIANIVFVSLQVPISSIPQFWPLGKNYPSTSNCVNRKWSASGTGEQIESPQAVPIEPPTHIVNRRMKVCQLRRNATEILADQHVGHRPIR
jgi:hypothetical protein